jgi:hypothetical protein
MRDIISHIHLVAAIAPIAAAQTDDDPVVSTILDRMGYDAVALAIVTGVLADSDATFAVALEHGETANMSDAEPVPSDQRSGGPAAAGFTAGDDGAARKIGYVGGKRYLRATITPDGNTGAAPVAGLWILGRANQGPTPNPPA